MLIAHDGLFMKFELLLISIIIISEAKYKRIAFF